jgi:hypothetical protein
VAELDKDDKEVVDDEVVYAVEPESWDDRELWLIVWLNPGPLPALLVEKTGAVFVLERGPWDCAICVATPPDDMNDDGLESGSAFKAAIPIDVEIAMREIGG